MICFVQRFGSSLNLHPHFHILSIDGVYKKNDTGWNFRQMSMPNNEELLNLLKSISDKVKKFLIKKEFLYEEEGVLYRENTTEIFKSEVEEEVHLSAMDASILNKIAFGENAGKTVKKIKSFSGYNWGDEGEKEIIGDLCVGINGYTLRAKTRIKSDEKTKLEKLIAYMSRGALSDERINLTEDGNILVKIKTAWKDGTTHVKFTPLEFLEKLVALIPPPWFNLTRYFGILSPHSKYRKEIVPAI